MALQNIGASNRDDAFYRYKMPRMITKIEGRGNGNGIKTNIVNMVEIAKALARPAAYTTKYFGCELGAQSKFDEKTGTSHVNGAHDTSKLAGLLENFIKKYVQCYGCGNPETEIIITKTQMLNLKCAACGFVSDVDMRDKLTTFILKNPPVQKKSAKEKKALRRADKEQLKEGQAADEEQKRLKKEAAKKKGTSSSKVSSKKKASGSDEDHSPTRGNGDGMDHAVEEEDDDDDDVQWQTDTSAEAAKKRIEEQLSAVTADMVMLNTIEEKKKSSPKSLEHEKEVEVKSENNGVNNIHGNLVDEIKQSLMAGNTAGQLKTLLGTLSGTPHEKMDALLEALFEGVGKGFSKAVNKKIKYISEATKAEGSQLVLLRGFESFCGKENLDATKELALVLKTMYDEDVLEEEFIMEWYQQGISGKAKNSPIWKSIEPFIEWLQSAESESEEE